jgi:hypothetical protein
MGRPIRGSRQSAFFPVDPNPSLSSLDSAFQLQEYISLLARLDPHDVERIVAIPGKSVTEAGGEKDAEKEKEKQAAPEDDRVAVDEACWIYEQLRYTVLSSSNGMHSGLMRQKDASHRI